MRSVILYFRFDTMAAADAAGARIADGNWWVRFELNLCWSEFFLSSNKTKSKGEVGQR